jgi:hypothetical protein
LLRFAAAAVELKAHHLGVLPPALPRALTLALALACRHQREAVKRQRLEEEHAALGARVEGLKRMANQSSAVKELEVEIAAFRKILNCRCAAPGLGVPAGGGGACGGRRPASFRGGRALLV